MKLIELNMTPAQITRSIRLGWGGAAVSAIITLLFTFIVSSVAPSALILWAVTSALVTGGRSRLARAVPRLADLVLPGGWLAGVASSQHHLPVLLRGGGARHIRASQGRLSQHRAFLDERRLTCA